MAVNEVVHMSLNLILPYSRGYLKPQSSFSPKTAQNKNVYDCKLNHHGKKDQVNELTHCTVNVSIVNVFKKCTLKIEQLFAEINEKHHTPKPKKTQECPLYH